MAKKTSTGKTGQPKKDVGAFVDFIHGNKKMRATVKKGWDEIISEGKKRGYKFTKAELHEYLKKRYNLKTLPDGNEPDTCLCI